MGFKVIKRQDTRLDGTQLEDFPNGKAVCPHPLIRVNII